MAEARAERRLAAILAADLAAYSRLMGAAEEGTLTALKPHRKEVIDPELAEHHGPIVKTTGNGALVELTSPPPQEPYSSILKMARRPPCRSAPQPSQREHPAAYDAMASFRGSFFDPGIQFGAARRVLDRTSVTRTKLGGSWK